MYFFLRTKSTDPLHENVLLKDTHSVSQEDKFAYGEGKPCTDKKENQIFLIYKEIENGAVAKSYMTNGLLIYGEIFAHFLIY